MITIRSCRRSASRFRLRVARAISPDAVAIAATAARFASLTEEAIEAARVVFLAAIASVAAAIRARPARVASKRRRDPSLRERRRENRVIRICPATAFAAAATVAARARFAIIRFALAKQLGAVTAVSAPAFVFGLSFAFCFAFRFRLVRVRARFCIAFASFVTAFVTVFLLADVARRFADLCVAAAALDLVLRPPEITRTCAASGRIHLGFIESQVKNNRRAEHQYKMAE